MCQVLTWTRVPAAGFGPRVKVFLPPPPPHAIWGPVPGRAACPGVGVSRPARLGHPARGPRCQHSPDMVQQLLAVVVVLLEPGLELGWGDHQQRVTRLP